MATAPLTEAEDRALGPMRKQIEITDEIVKRAQGNSGAFVEWAREHFGENPKIEYYYGDVIGRFTVDYEPPEEGTQMNENHDAEMALMAPQEVDERLGGKFDTMEEAEEHYNKFPVFQCQPIAQGGDCCATTFSGFPDMANKPCANRGCAMEGGDGQMVPRGRAVKLNVQASLEAEGQISQAPWAVE